MYNISKSKKFIKLKLCAFYIFLLCLPQSAFAYSMSGDSVKEFIANVCAWLSGDLARGVAVAAVIFLGYRTLKGRIDWHYAAIICVGMGLVMGSSYYGSIWLGGS